MTTVALITALSTFREIDEEVKALETQLKAERAVIETEVRNLGGKAHIKGLAKVQLVPSSTSHSYDTEGIDQLILRLYADGTKDGIEIAGALTALRKETTRKESLRITVESPV